MAHVAFLSSVFNSFIDIGSKKEASSLQKFTHYYIMRLCSKILLLTRNKDTNVIDIKINLFSSRHPNIRHDISATESWPNAVNAANV